MLVTAPATCISSHPPTALYPFGLLAFSRVTDAERAPDGRRERQTIGKELIKFAEDIATSTADAVETTVTDLLSSVPQRSRTI